MIMLPFLKGRLLKLFGKSTEKTTNIQLLRKLAINTYMRLTVKKDQHSVKKSSVLKETLKKLYRLVSEITGTKSENPMPPGKGDNILAEEFAEYFMN